MMKYLISSAKVRSYPQDRAEGEMAIDKSRDKSRHRSRDPVIGLAVDPYINLIASATFF